MLGACHCGDAEQYPDFFQEGILQAWAGTGSIGSGTGKADGEFTLFLAGMLFPRINPVSDSKRAELHNAWKTVSISSYYCIFLKKIRILNFK